jgi:hypothetical protein
MFRTRLLLGTMLVSSILPFFDATSLAGEDSLTVARSLDVANLIGKPVTNSRWVQIARVERVLVDPSQGRATFVVLSFLDRDEMLALPWGALHIDASGRAQLTAGPKTLDAAPRFYGARMTNVSPSISPSLPYRYESPAAGPSPVSFRIVSGSKGILQGTVTGLMSLPDEAGRRHARALMDVGGETIRVDLGPENALALAVRTGDHLQVLGRYQAGKDFQAVEVRRGARTFRIERYPQEPYPAAPMVPADRRR